MIFLDGNELRRAGYVGVDRRVNAIISDFSSATGIDKSMDPWGRDIESACAEEAYGKHSDHYWDGSVGRFRSSPFGDVGDTEVRWTRYKNGALILREKDIPHIDSWFYLVTGLSTDGYEVVGKIWGRDAMVEKHWKDPDGRGFCWWIEQEHLILER